MSDKPLTGPLVMERYGRNLAEMDRSFDIAYWQAQPEPARFAAGWELVVHSFIMKGKDVAELRLQRTVEHFQRGGN